MYSTADAESAVVRFADEAVQIGPPADRPQLPPHPEHHRRRSKTGRRRHPPRLRLPLRGPLLRRDLLERGDHLHRAAAGGDGEGGRQGDRARADAEGGPAAPAGHGRSGQHRRRGARDRRRDRLPGDHQGRRRRRRPRDERRLEPRRSCRALYQTTRATAQAVFKDSAVYIERYLEAPRHTEVQIVCDSHGNGVYFGERDCSVQRRHQKLIEEAPSTHLTPEMRQDIGEKAVAGALCDRLHGRRDDGVPARPRRQLRLHGDERPHPGRAPGQRDDHERRPDPGADPGRGRRAAVRLAGRRRSSAATRSSAGSTPRTPTRTSPRPPGGSRPTCLPEGPWTRVDSHCYPGLDGQPVLRLADREADRLGPRPGRAPSSGCGAPLGEFEITGRGVKTTIPFHQRILANDPVPLGRRVDRLRRAVHGRGTRACRGRGDLGGGDDDGRKNRDPMRDARAAARRSRSS